VPEHSVLASFRLVLELTEKNQPLILIRWREVKRVTEFLLILYRWMVAILDRAERVLNRGWPAVREHSALPNSSDRFGQVMPAWNVRERDSTQSAPRRRGWMTYCWARSDGRSLGACACELLGRACPALFVRAYS
jgi:hypothetical protein